jgi:hypothetical protein
VERKLSGWKGVKREETCEVPGSSDLPLDTRLLLLAQRRPAEISSVNTAASLSKARTYVTLPARIDLVTPTRLSERGYGALLLADN